MRTSNIERPTSNIERKKRVRFLSFNVRRSMFGVRCSYLFFLLSLAATTAPVTQPTAANLEVHEWAVFVVDGATGQLNPEGIVTATLPPFVTDHRFGSSSTPAPAMPIQNRRFFFFAGRAVMAGNTNDGSAAEQASSAENDEPSPVGVIRLIGSADSKVDVSIQSKGGNFLGSWPKAEERTNELLWRDLTVANQSDALPPAVGPNHWFTVLRSVASAFVSAEHSGTDKFLLYDLEMPYASPLKAKEQPDFSMELSNTSAVPLHNLTLYQGGDHDTLHTLAVGDLLPTTKPTTSPSTVPTTKPMLKLTAAATTQPFDLADSWKPIMSRAGVDAADADVIEHLIVKYAFDPHRLTAVYKMDDAEFDRLLPLEVVPQPAKITRFGLVIVINADPTGGTMIDDLIKQLGDEDWSKRDAAYHTLAGMGPAATEKLKTASKSTDLEIAWRAERLLALSPQVAK